MRRIGLVACSALKIKEAEEHKEQLFSAKDIYCGPDFLKSVNEGLTLFNCDGYYILSDKHGLLKPCSMIPWYDYSIPASATGLWKIWSNDVYSSLQTELGDLEQYEFVFFASNKYSRFLKDQLNCIILKVKNRRLTFEI